MDGEKGVGRGGGVEVGGEGDYIRIYLSLHCHHQNDSCMNSDESHFNVSLIVRDKVTRQCPQTITFLKRKERRAKSSRGHSAYQPYGLRLGQTDS